MNLACITPLILTFNEEPNLGRCLDRLSWAPDILVLDSGSTDKTLEIAKSYPQVRVLHRAFDSFAGQCNFGLEHITSEWVLSLDADYILSNELTAELRGLSGAESMSGYRARFTYCIWGRALRKSLYPPRTVLYRREHARYANDGHGHRVQVEGAVANLVATIGHDDRKSLGRWLVEQDKYMIIEAEKLASMAYAELNWPDRIRRCGVLAPSAVFFYSLLYNRLILDGWPGMYYVFQRTIAEMILSLRLIERKLLGISHKNR